METRQEIIQAIEKAKRCYRQKIGAGDRMIRDLLIIDLRNQGRPELISIVKEYFNKPVQGELFE